MTAYCLLSALNQIFSWHDKHITQIQWVDNTIVIIIVIVIYRMIINVNVINNSINSKIIKIIFAKIK